MFINYQINEHMVKCVIMVFRSLIAYDKWQPNHIVSGDRLDQVPSITISSCIMINMVFSYIPIIDAN